MRFSVGRVAFVLALGAAVACSLADLSGLSDGDTGTAPDAGTADAASIDALAVDASNDTAPPPCKASTQIDTTLTTDLGSWTAFTQALTGYPKVEGFFGSTATVLFPFVDTTPVPIDAGDPDAGPTFFNPPQHVDAVSALWQTTPVALRSFDVELEAQVRCTKPGSCADGLAFAWLGTTSRSVLTKTYSGGAQGLPAAVDGVAVLLDDYQNDATASSDPAVPSLQIVQLDRTKIPGTYRWGLTSKTTPFLGAWHTLGVSLRGTTVTVRYDGVSALSATVTALVSGLVGITAGTGGQTDAVAVRNFKGSFYDCVP